MKKKFQFKKCDCVVDIKFTHRQNLIINKKLNLKKIVKNEFAISNKNENIKKFDFLNIDDDQLNHEKKSKKKIDVFFEFFELSIKFKKQTRRTIFDIYYA